MTEEREELPAYLILRNQMWESGYGDGTSILQDRVNSLIKEGYAPCGGLYIGLMETNKPYLCQAMYRDPKGRETP